MGGYKTLYCLLKFSGLVNDRVSRGMAGAAAGTAIMVDAKSRRSVIALYILIRAADVLGRLLSQKKYIPDFRYSTELLFGFSNAFIMFGFLMQPELLPEVRGRIFVNSLLGLVEAESHPHSHGIVALDVHLTGLSNLPELL